MTMARPIMKATTGLAWCAGTGSTVGISGVGVAARVEVAVATEESMQRQRRERRGRRREGEGDDGTSSAPHEALIPSPCTWSDTPRRGMNLTPLTRERASRLVECIAYLFLLFYSHILRPSLRNHGGPHTDERYVKMCSFDAQGRTHCAI